MLKKLIIIISLLQCGTLIGHDIQTNFFPGYQHNVSREQYNQGYARLKSAYEQIANDEYTVKVPDYWNVAVSYSIMGVSSDTIYQLLSKMKRLDSVTFCDYSAYAIDVQNGLEKSRFFSVLGPIYSELVRSCNLSITNSLTLEKLIQNKTRLEITGLNEELIDRLIHLMSKDQKFRYKSSLHKQNFKKQAKLDLEVSIELAEIFDQFGYPGKDIVGEHYKNYACLFLEHSGGENLSENLAFKEKYLPMILDAFKMQQLDFEYVQHAD